LYIKCSRFCSYDHETCIWDDYETVKIILLLICGLGNRMSKQHALLGSNVKQAAYRHASRHDVCDMTQRKEDIWKEWDYENRRTPVWVMMLTSAFVSFVSYFDVCLDAVGVRPPLRSSERARHFEGIYRPHPQDRKIIQARNQQKQAANSSSVDFYRTTRRQRCDNLKFNCMSVPTPKYSFHPILSLLTIRSKCLWFLVIPNHPSAYTPTCNDVVSHYRPQVSHYFSVCYNRMKLWHVKTASLAWLKT
jgi:hypothetical protein